MGKHRIRVLAAVAVVGLIAGACGKAAAPKATPSTTAPTTPSGTVPADSYIRNTTAFVDAADWDAAAHVAMDMGEMFFKPKAYTFEAGKPYVLEVTNSGKKKHEVVAEDFFRSSAVRKFESTISEVKIRVVTEFEVFAGKKVELFVIPVMPGTYELFCAIEGHREKGMEGSITVTGTVPTTPAPEVAKLADSGWVLDAAARIDAADWDAALKLTVDMGEMFFKPKNVALKAGVPAILTIVNTGKKKHEFVADDFMPTAAFRKAEDGIGEFKGLSLNEVEVLPGKQIELFLIPTKAGTYLLVCEIEGHREKGMEGTITVS